ncbi:MAG: CvpA family protein [Pirellulales bacterium]|nr:CvpA family protein [Pirellulales bacterium]
MHVDLFLTIIFVLCFASTAMQGVWNNAITLINVVLAALLATNYWEPVASWLDAWEHRYTYLWDILAIWLVFGVSFGILRTVTDKLSTVRVRFITLVDRIGGAFLSAWASWIMVCFTAMTLHLAPLAPNFMLGSFQPEPDSRMFMGMAPDRQWIALVHKVSGGSLTKGDTKQFDEQAEIILKYHTRRERLEELGTMALP